MVPLAWGGGKVILRQRLRSPYCSHCLPHLLQIVLSNITPPVLAVYVIHSQICTYGGEDLLFAELVSTSLFMAGVATFLQVTFGVRHVFRSSPLSYTFVYMYCILRGMATP